MNNMKTAHRSRISQRSRAKPTTRGRIRGVSLIEVMIALFVLSIGLLGLAALQTVSLKYNHQSNQRTQAIFQAYDIIDRIRANSVGKTAGYYDNVTIGFGANTTITTDCHVSACNTQQLATYDIIKWNTANDKLLADGKGRIETLAAGRRRVTIQWNEGDLPTSLVIQVDL